MDELEQKGEEIFYDYCSSSDISPVMLPRAPKQKYPDIFPEDDEPGSNFQDRIIQQANYEAEVVVYRVLENVNENIIVLHSFEYTHHLYSLCDKTHERKGCDLCKRPNAIHGECDFLIVCGNSFVIIEVKNVSPNNSPEVNQEERLRGSFSNSLEQRHKIEKLIKAIDKDANVQQFTAFPSCSNIYTEHFHATDAEIKTMIFKENLADDDTFSAWWKDNVSSPAETRGRPLDSHFKTRNVLLAIWASEIQGKKKSDVNKLKCSLAATIREIDKELKRGKITFLSKRLDLNPRVIEAPPVIKKYLEVEHLNKQQYDAFSSAEKLLWLHGPAGTGKTIIMCAKMIQLVAESAEDYKAIVFKFSGAENNSKLYQTALMALQVDNAEMRYDYEVIQAERTQPAPSKIFYTILKKIKDNKVIVIEIIGTVRLRWLTAILRELTELKLSYKCHFFLDDVQSVLGFNTCDVSTEFVSAVVDLSSDKFSIWLSCDIAQSWNYLKTDDISDLANLLTQQPPNQRIHLTMNLRNTRNLSYILSVIRDEYIGLKSENCDILDVMLPIQTHGHYIHGPKTVVHILKECSSYDHIVDIFSKELAKLVSCRDLAQLNSCLDVGIVYRYLSSVLEKGIRRAIEGLSSNSNIDMCECECSYSAEWPVVIVLYKLLRCDDEKDLTGLYSAIARARVHCSIILYLDDDLKWEDFVKMNRLSQKLKNRIILKQHRV